MSLKGDLSTIGLAEVFQMISNSGREGTLIVYDAESRKAIYFGSDGVRLLSTGKRKGLRLGEVLARTGLVSDDKLQAAVEISKFQKRMLGEVLVESGLVSEEEVERIVRQQIQEEIYDLFLWRKANFEFIDGPPPVEALRNPDLPVIKLSFDVNGLLLESVRRADEWGVIHGKIPSQDCIFRFASPKAQKEAAAGASNGMDRIHDLLNGRTSVADMIELTGMSKFEVSHHLTELANRGVIALLPTVETMDLASRRLAAGRKEEALRLYAAAADQDPGDPDVALEVARILEEQGEGRSAAGYFARAGRLVGERGDPRGAAGYLEKAIVLDPDGKSAKRDLFEVSASSGDLERAKRLGREIVADAMSAPDYPRAQEVCDRVLERDPEDLGFRVNRALVLHRTKQAAGLEEDLSYVRSHMPSDPHEADRILRDLREILGRYPSTIQHPSKIVKPGKGGGRRAARVIVPALLALLVAGGVSYEIRARAAFREVLGESEKLAEGKSYAGATEKMREFLGGAYRFSLFQSGDARKALDDLEARGREWEGERERGAEKERLAAREGMERLLVAMEAQARVNPAQALEDARALEKLGVRHGNGEYALAARERIGSLEEYLKGALDLQQKAEDLEREGKIREAALAVDRILSTFPNTDAARVVRFPMDVATRPSGVRIKNVRTGEEAGMAPLRLRLTPGEVVRLSFEKGGYESVEREIRDKTAGSLLVVLDRKKESWVMPLGFSVSGRPAYREGSLFVAGENRLYALNVWSRRLDWFESLEGRIAGGPRCVGDRVFVATRGRRVYAVNPGTTEPRVAWEYAGSDGFLETPAVSPDGKVLYAGTSDRWLCAIDAATGKELWKRPLPAETRIEPVALETGVVVGCEDGTMLAVKGPKPEDEAWKFRGGAAYGPILLSGGVLYAVAENRTLYALDAATGRERWRRRAPAPVPGRPAVAAGRVAVAATDGSLYLFDARSGESAGSFETGGPLQGGVVGEGTLLLFGSDDGIFRAYDAVLGGIVWTLETGRRIRIPPVISAGQAYFVSEGNLYAVELN